jgi:NhaP-type Na+/H+ or K+/H+ antiporter
MKRVQRWAEWAPVAVIGGAMLWYALLDGDQRASESLYEMAAQIIPVLILALALESQVKDRWRKWRGAFRLQTILALLLGELAAVWPRRSGK